MAAPVIHSRNDNQGSTVGYLDVTLTNAPQSGGLLVVTGGIFLGSSNAADGITLQVTGGSSISTTERANSVGTTGNSVGVVIFTVEYATAPTSVRVLNNVSATGCYMSVSCLNITGQAGSYFDVAGVSTGTSTSPVATAMGDLTDATDLVIGAMTRGGVSGTIAPATNWTEVVELSEDNAIQTLSVIQRTPGATGAYDPAWTISSSDDWEAAGIAIKGTASGGTANPWYYFAQQ